jgi:polar amino acid transport system permease protein
LLGLLPVHPQPVDDILGVPGPLAEAVQPHPGVAGPEPAAGEPARAERRQAGRNSLIAVVSVVVVFGGLALAIANAPNWPQVQSSFPEIARAFLLNCKIFSISECFILVFALLLAVLRSLPGPVFFPLRALAIVYADFFRGVPTILVIAILGYGAPALKLSGVPKSTTFWGIVSLVLVYSAYVSEVYRAGIDSVHPSQEAAARSLGLTRGQTLRKVILPQAVRRVIPPLLNDFIGLQKDTALVGTLGAIEAFNQAQIDTFATFHYTSYLAAAVLFVAITIPLARFTDWLIARDRRRRQAQGAFA